MALTEDDKRKIRETAIRNLEVQAYQTELDMEINPSIHPQERALLETKLHRLQKAIELLETKNGGPKL